MSKSVVLSGRIKEGGYGLTLLGSVAAHLLLLAAIVILPWLFPGTPIRPGSGGSGGGGSDQPIPINLTGELLGGGTGTFRPTPKPAEPAVETPRPQPEKPDPNAIDIPDPSVKAKKEKKERKPKEEPPTKIASNLSPGEQKVKHPAKVPDSYVPTKTEPGAGGVPGLGVGSQGVGVGIGDGTGGGGGGGIGDSWYARQVEKRIGSNWLRSLVGNVPAGKFTAVISFYVMDNGTIAKMNMERSSGIPTLDDSAKRAIYASNPLAPLPPELRGKPVKFTALFEYPPPR